MSLLALGVSHRTAPVPMLERLALPADAQVKLLRELTENAAIDEAMVVATCNRVEIYVEADKFHPAVDAATEGLARATGVMSDELVPHLYVHYEDRAVQHLFSMASGLDSMVVGEAQILGQVRQSLALGSGRGQPRSRAQRPRADGAPRGQARAQRDRYRHGRRVLGIGGA